MKLMSLSYKEAREHYPDIVAQSLKDMSGKFRRAKLDMPAPEEFSWSLQWAGEVPQSRPPLRGVSTTFYCRYDRRVTQIRFPDAKPGEPEDSHLPHHVLAYYKGVVDPAKIPNAGVFNIRNPNGSVDQAIATGGYVCDGIVAVHYLIVGDPWHQGVEDEQLIELRGNRATFEGGLKEVARKRYEAAGEGNDFSFGSRQMRRLTLAEITPHIAGKTFNWSLF